MTNNKLRLVIYLIVITEQAINYEIQSLQVKYCFTPLGAVAFTSCVDNDKNLFDVEKTKELYQSSFPVQNIDPSMDWKTTQGVNVSVSVNEDMGTNYKVQLFDANPLNKNSNARLLAEGYANQDMKLETTMDCPTALTTVFVARADNKGRTS